MKLWKRILAVAVVAVAAGVLLYFGIGSNRLASLEVIPDNALISRPTINLWYTDEALGDYLGSVALDFSEEKNVRVIPKLVSGLEYLENINRDSLQTNTYPDLYIISNESLEKASLSGLVSPIRDEAGAVNESNFSRPALEAVTYDGKLVGYPFYFETSALVYNKTYMEALALSALEAEADALAGEEAMQELDENGEPLVPDGEGNNPEPETFTADEAQLQERIEAMIPATIDDILTFANSYDAPEQVEAVFKWDVADIFYNYFFVGNYINVGGPTGDNTEKIDIYNLDSIKCLMAYQDLNQFFSIDPEEVDYDSVVREFIEGKLVFTVATTDIVAKIEEAKKNGEFPYEYGVTNIPNINEELQTKSLSVTNAVVVNGYSQKKDIANEFAAYLTVDRAQNLYERTGRMPARKGVTFTSPQAEAFGREYELSVPIPKMMATSNYWVQMEIAFTRIWSGDGVSDTLKALSEKIMTQVTGQPFEEEYIEEPEKEEYAGEEE
ncbi:sugar ABC transporter substrate-binding protein [Eisenbergiella tayi]|uniref:sugar ABC transporter substrate-binding protein n=1 Tax=Eisenbergiella tayi TaxID=1432052 RepID=UPI00084841E0|nr:extracellular solute-binding protein [Eisenbergiella tayi]ODR32844.1 sugar ABC transporter substrate-binding protein [Eisenbergiella tayi]